MAHPKTDLLQGTLDMLILKALQLEPMHGFGLTVRLRQMSNDLFQVEMDPSTLRSADSRPGDWSAPPGASQTTTARRGSIR
jgi:hypothetical protein